MGSKLNDKIPLTQNYLEEVARICEKTNLSIHKDDSMALGFTFAAEVLGECHNRIVQLEKELTTTYDLVAESIGEKQYDYEARAKRCVERSKDLLK